MKENTVPVTAKTTTAATIAVDRTLADVDERKRTPLLIRPRMWSHSKRRANTANTGDRLVLAKSSLKPSHSRTLPVLTPDNQNGHVQLVANRSDCVSENQILQAAVAMSAHDHQIGMDLPGVAQDLARRRSRMGN